ncbi:hypothetical protein AB3Y40_05460 [Yoonia sp. R2331]|uniref:hypothetical protein n=1 Tax=Yoonia sp. R2331 TaxID=3237238 RepID=UPI0034E5DCF6
MTCAALAACADPQVSQGGARPSYDGVQTRLLEGDLVGFDVALRGADGPEAVTTYAECAAAQYALIRGYGFARHVRTNLDKQGGTWRADAVYTISPDLPAGAKTIDAEVIVANCGASGIPTA